MMSYLNLLGSFIKDSSVRRGMMCDKFLDFSTKSKSRWKTLLLKAETFSLLG